MKNLARALQFFRPDAARLVLVLALMVISTLANLIKPWPLALMVDCVLGDNPFPRPVSGWMAGWRTLNVVGALSLAILVLHALQGAFSAAHNFLSIRIGLRGLTRVRNEVFGRLQRLSFRAHSGSNSGDLIYRASWDTYAFQTLFQQGLVTFATASLSLILMLVVMARLNVPLTLVALATVPVLAFVIQFFGRRMSERSMAAQKADSKLTSLVQQSIMALPLVQSYNREEFEARRFAVHAATAQEQRLAQHRLEIIYWLAIMLIFGLGTAAIAFVGVRQVWVDRLTIGQLLVFLAYLGQLYEPLNQLSNVGSTVSSVSAGTKRIFEILDAVDEVKEAPNARSVVPFDDNKLNVEEFRKVEVEEGLFSLTSRAPLMVRGAIQFDHVSFGYEKEKLVLRTISFSLAPGQSAAIIGPSGSGKTTLLNLLPRFFDPTEGAIYLDGTNLRELRLTDLRAQIAMVAQEPIILMATVAENIAYGKPGAARSEIEGAARAAHADDFIRNLPQAYETQLGESGMTLSVGEKQRINLARSFLKDAPILILDEPTSALDSESEALVVASLHELMCARTTLVVAHRLTTIARVENILSLEGGRLTECGSPGKLKEGHGYYARILRGQSQLG